MSLLVNRQIQKSQRGNQLILFCWSWCRIFITVCTFSGPHSVSFSIPFLRERALIRQIESESIRVKWIPNPPCVWCHAWTGADQCLKIFQQMVCSAFRLQCLLDVTDLLITRSPSFVNHKIISVFWSNLNVYWNLQ